MKRIFWIFTFGIWLSAIGAWAAYTPPTASDSTVMAATQDEFLFANFQYSNGENDSLGCIMARSPDGKSVYPFTPGYFSFTSSAGTTHQVRDCRIIKIGDWWYVGYTQDYPDTTCQFGLKKSKDLVNWTSITTPVYTTSSISGVTQVWFTGFFHEPSDDTYYITFIGVQSDVSTNKACIVTFDPSNDSFSSVRFITGIPAGSVVPLDSGIIKDGSTYNIFYSGGSPGTNRATSTSRESGYSTQTISGSIPQENINVVPLRNGTWRMYCLGLQYCDSATLSSWGSFTTIPSSQGPTRFWGGAGVIRVTDLKEQAIINAAAFAGALWPNQNSSVLADYTFSGNLRSTGTLSATGGGTMSGTFAGNMTRTGTTTFSGATAMQTASATTVSAATLTATNATITSGTAISLTAITATAATLIATNATVTGTLTFAGKINASGVGATTGDINTGSAGVYSFNGSGRYVRFNTNGGTNDLLSEGSLLNINNTGQAVAMFPGVASTLFVNGALRVGGYAGDNPPATRTIYIEAGTSQGSTPSLTAASTLWTGGNIVLGAAGSGLQIKEGTNAKFGTATLSSGVATVTTSAVTATSSIWISRQSANSSTTLGVGLIPSITAGTSFTITAKRNDGSTTETGDTSRVKWLILDPAP